MRMGTVFFYLSTNFLVLYLPAYFTDNSETIFLICSLLLNAINKYDNLVIVSECGQDCRKREVSDMADNEVADKSGIKVKSLVKAMEVLECFSTKTPALGISEIASSLKINKATVYNIVSTFVSMGYLVQDPATQKYHLGLKLLHFSYVINQQSDLTSRVIPYLQKIANATNEICYLGIPYEDKVLYLATRTPAGGVPRTILGEKAPMYCTGLGKALLAFMPEDRRPLLPDHFEAFTNNTITEKSKLMEDLDLIRQRGFAIDNMEHEFGVSCVAVPIFGHDHIPVAAVSVSGPSLRFDLGTTEKIYRETKEILEEIQYVF